MSASDQVDISILCILLLVFRDARSPVRVALSDKWGKCVWTLEGGSESVFRAGTKTETNAYCRYYCYVFGILGQTHHSIPTSQESCVERSRGNGR